MRLCVFVLKTRVRVAFLRLWLVGVGAPLRARTGLEMVHLDERVGWRA